MAGFIVSKIVSGSGQGVLMGIGLGIVGAVMGGWLFNTFGMAGVAGLNLYSLLVAIVGAVLVFVLYHAVSRRAHQVGGIKKFFYSQYLENES